MIKTLATTIPHPKNGKWKEFNKYATLIAEGFYVNNQKHGTWKEYYDHTGTIMIEENFLHGVSHGRFTSYHPNGKILSQGEFYNGLREGYFNVYNEEGNNIRSLLFINNIQTEDINKLAYTGEKKDKNGS
jgi:antitoxin component YwqK of YwqJK toxin-antitoxin module